MRLSDRELLLVANAARLGAAYVEAFPQRCAHEAVAEVLKFLHKDDMEIEEYEAEEPKLPGIKKLIEEAIK